MKRAADISSLMVGDAVKKLNPNLFGNLPEPNGPIVFPKAFKVADNLVELLSQGPKPASRYRSKWEEQFHEVLKARFPNAWIEHEPFRLKLADGAWYKPDFAVAERWIQDLDGKHNRFATRIELTFWEVKGHWREAARVRIKVAARLFPWAKFVAVVKKKKSDGGGWSEEVFP